MIKLKVWANITRALHGSLLWFCTDGYGFQEPRVQMVRGYGFHIIAVGARMVPEKLGLLRSGLRFLGKSAIWLRSGLRFQVKSAGRFRSGLHSTSFVPNGDISHAFNFRHAVQMTLSRVIDKMVVDEGRALQPCRYRWCTHSLVLFSTHTAHNRAVGTHT